MENDANRKKVLLGDMDVVLRGEELHWKQKAKCKWLKEGDNTRFFHKVASGKRRRNLISRMNIWGVEIDNEDMIKDEVIRFLSFQGYMLRKIGKDRLLTICSQDVWMRKRLLVWNAAFMKRRSRRLSLI